MTAQTDQNDARCGHEWTAPMVMPPGQRPRWIHMFLGFVGPPTQKCKLPADHPIDEPHRDGKVTKRNTGTIARRPPVGLYRP